MLIVIISLSYRLIHMFWLMRGSRKLSWSWQRFFYFFINVFHRGPYRPPSRSNSPDGSNCFWRGPSKISKEPESRIVTCDFPEEGSGPLFLRLDQPMWVLTRRVLWSTENICLGLFYQIIITCTGASEPIHVKCHIVGNLMSQLISVNGYDDDIITIFCPKKFYIRTTITITVVVFLSVFTFAIISPRKRELVALL